MSWGVGDHIDAFWVGVGVVLESARLFAAVTISSQSTSILVLAGGFGINAAGLPVRLHSSSLSHSSGWFAAKCAIAAARRCASVSGVLTVCGLSSRFLFCRRFFFALAAGFGFGICLLVFGLITAAAAAGAGLATRAYLRVAARRGSFLLATGAVILCLCGGVFVEVGMWLLLGESLVLAVVALVELSPLVLTLSICIA